MPKNNSSEIADQQMAFVSSEIEKATTKIALIKYAATFVSVVASFTALLTAAMILAATAAPPYIKMVSALSTFLLLICTGVNAKLIFTTGTLTADVLTYALNLVQIIANEADRMVSEYRRPRNAPYN